jgi:hypothetical protein
VTGSDHQPPGKHTLRVDFKYDGGGLAKGGVATLLVDGKKVGEARVAQTIPGRSNRGKNRGVPIERG